MKVFEDFIEELKGENLLEEDVPETDQTNSGPSPTAPVDLGPKTVPKEEPKGPPPPSQPPAVQKNEVPAPAFNNSEVKLPVNENDFYRRRAMEEVSSLQMVERVFSAVEREQAKVSPKPYDDIAVSKALHDFLQVSKNANSQESAAAEFKLMQETESWYSALSHRDQHLLPVHLRRYCETTRPVLSSQALVALARFYRNSPFSESVRSKFDLIVTRLFSQEKDNDERVLAFEFDDLVQHLSELYADWSSIPLYSTDDDTELSIIALKFEDFIMEALDASGFEELVRTDFFNRLRAFKESTGENFYAPPVTATAIKCNILVGNRYVELLREEKKKNNAASLEDKYNYLLDQTISEATSKTLQLVQLLKEKQAEPEEPPPAPAAAARDPKEAREPRPARDPKVSRDQKVSGDLKVYGEPKIEFDFPEDETPERPQEKRSFKQNLFNVNKWLLALTVFTVLGTFGLYYWVEYINPQSSASKEVQVLELDGYYFKDYIRVGKITNETLICVAAAPWYGSTEEKKQEILNNLLSVGRDKGYKAVRILGSDGKTVGYVTSQSITKPNSNQN